MIADSAAGNVLIVDVDRQKHEPSGACLMISAEEWNGCIAQKVHIQLSSLYAKEIVPGYFPTRGTFNLKRGTWYNPIFFLVACYDV